MPTTPLPDDVKDILDKPVFAHVATINPDGSPQSSVVWVERDGDLILFSTADGRVKPRNLAADDRVAVSFTDPEDPYRAISIQGRAVTVEKSGNDLIHRLAAKYLGEERYPWLKPGEERVDVAVATERISG
jgi:PPOX class probable F420-dependent enzyme